MGGDVEREDDEAKLIAKGESFLEQSPAQRAGQL